jgi:branched-chain amino acid transport system ATP-binding protein
MSSGLRARAVSVRVGESLIVDRVSIDVVPGKVTALSGPNGAGKSTLFDCLSGSLPAATGTIVLEGANVTRATPDRRSRIGLARTFQHLSIFPTLTVEENLLVGAEHRGELELWRALFQGRLRERERTPDVVEEILARLGLRSVRDERASALPTATLRMVELGRALCTRPTVLLLDEPASGLDDDETERLRTLLRALSDEGLAILLVEHDVELVRSVADVLYVMQHGCVRESGDASELLSRPEILSMIGGAHLRERRS